jgi:hypothetical protein
MKTIITKVLCLALAASAIGLGGCATNSVKDQESLLSAAGFRERTPSTAKQRALYVNLPPHQLQRASVNGKIFYVYKDEAKGTAYIGGVLQYQEYQKLATEKRIAQDYYMAAEMNRDTAMGWYGAWGARSLWW